MKVNEIFYSIQGEGIYSGLPMVFVRMQGCNLLPNCCSFCDTSYAQDGSGGSLMEVGDIAEKVNLLNPRYQSWVCITGGEPLFQLDGLYSLVRELKRLGKHITIETNGSIHPPKWYTIVDSWNADIKCPSSGVCGVSKKTWFDTRFCDQVKFVVGTEEDLDFARGLINRYAASMPIVLVSPVFPREQDDLTGGECFIGNRYWLQRVAEFCKELRVRYSLQTQKIAYGDRRGV